MIIVPTRLPRYSQYGAQDIWYFKSVALDLSGANIDVFAFYAYEAVVLSGYTVLYEQASSGDAAVNIRVGRMTSAGVHDDDYYDIVASEVSKSIGYSKSYLTASLTNTAIAAGQSVTVGTAGGKTGAGVVSITLHINIP